MRLKWVETDGGPLIVASKHAALKWNGINECDDAGMDYDRACLIEGYTGKILIGNEYGVVLGDEPMATTWLIKDGEIVLIRVVYLDDIDSAIESIRHVSDSEWRQTDCVIESGGDGLILFDATLSGEELDHEDDESHVNLDVSPGLYHVETAEFQPNESTNLILHRLRIV